MREPLVNPRNASDAASAHNEASASEKPHRLQLVFSADAYRRLNDAKHLSGASSQAQTVRDAIRVFAWFLQQRRDGFEIALLRDDKVEKVVELIL